MFLISYVIFSLQLKTWNALFLSIEFHWHGGLLYAAKYNVFSETDHNGLPHVVKLICPNLTDNSLPVVIPHSR